MAPSPSGFKDWDDERLGRALRSVCEERLPPTPALDCSVSARLTSSLQTSGKSLTRSRLVGVAALLAAVLAGSLALSPAVREAAADLFGVDGISIEVTEEPPSSGVSGPGSSQPGTSSPDFGEITTLASAGEAVSFPIGVPAHLGPPDRVYIDEVVPGGLVSLVFDPRPGLPETERTGVGAVIMQFQGDVEDAFLKKIVGPETSLELVEVGGRTAFWVSGAPHPLVYLDPEGNLAETPVRLAGDTLLFSRRGVTYRIEGAFSKEKALDIARSL